MVENYKMNDKIVFEEVYKENTAQAILHKLIELENKRPQFENRWIWELMQNALDATTKDASTKIELELADDKVIFRHDGKHFSVNEVAHLIAHGTTKFDDKVSLGQFGTGFLTTHLLSKTVTVTGINDKSQHFQFHLDRNGKDVPSILQAMKISESQYYQSLGKKSSLKKGFTTEYSYQLQDDDAQIVSDAGLLALKRISPFIIAFNSEFKSITLTNKGIREEFIKKSSQICGSITLTCVNVPQPEKVVYVATNAHEDVHVAILLIEENGKMIIQDISKVPKLFLAFPLYGTEDFFFAAIVNCRLFIPQETRDGIFLGTDQTEMIQKNKTYLEKACELFIELIDHAIDNNWLDLHLLASLSNSINKDWLDHNWYDDNLSKLVSLLQDKTIVESSNGPITPNAALIPVSQGDVSATQMWELAAVLFESQMPQFKYCEQWATIISEWSAILGEKLNCTVDFNEISERVSGIGNLAELQEQILPANGVKQIVTSIEYMNKLLSVIINNDQVSILDNMPLLPNQNGHFKLRSGAGLERDDDIDDDFLLKFPWCKDRLLNKKIVKPVSDLLPVSSQEKLLNDIINLIKGWAKQTPLIKGFNTVNPDLFHWIITNEKFSKLQEYPVFVRKKDKDGNEQIGYIGKDSLLAPIENWSNGALNWADLFPEERIISSIYYTKVNSDTWRKLREASLSVFDQPLIITNEPLKDLDGYLLPGTVLPDDMAHEITTDLSAIAFLDLADRGIIDAVRGSQSKARRFLDFIFKCVLQSESSAINPVACRCSCEEDHQVLASKWLRILRTQKWVPIKKGRSELPNSINLANLLIDTDPSLLDLIPDETVSRFLNNLGISTSDIMKHVYCADVQSQFELEKATCKLYSAFNADAGQLTEFADLIKDDPTTLNDIKSKYNTKQLIKRNQKIGCLIEDIFKEIISTIPGLTIEREPFGSDYAVTHSSIEESDFIDGGVEQLLSIEKQGSKRFLVEIKSTKIDLVKMTLLQGIRATEVENYMLCVVPVDEDIPDKQYVYNNCRFIDNIGKLIEPEVNTVKKAKDDTEALRESMRESKGDIAIDYIEGKYGFRIRQSIWDKGISFQSAVDMIKQT